VDDVLDALTVTGVPVTDTRLSEPILQVTRSRIQLDAALRTLPTTPEILYVKAAASGANNGSSWTDAYTDLQDALAVAFSGDQIWVAQGVYKPTGDPADRAATFQLHTGIAIYGGFGGAAGTEGDFSARDWRRYLSVLSGDIDNNDLTDPHGVITATAHITGTNSYHVVTGGGTVLTAVLDGFTITGGYAFYDGLNYRPCFQQCGGGLHNLSGSPTLRNLEFVGNAAEFMGGALYNTSGSNPDLSHSLLRSNWSDLGGGLGNYTYSSPRLTNVALSGNMAGGGGGMANYIGSGPILTNVTLSGNRAAVAGGGLYNSESNPIIQNSLFWSNQADTLGNSFINLYASVPTVRRSLVQDCNPGGVWDASCGADGGGNLADADPLFVAAPDPAAAPTEAGDFRLTAASAAIDQGVDAYLPISVTTDLAGASRRRDGDGDGIPTADMGAYEAQSTRWCGGWAAPYTFTEQGEVVVEFADVGKVSCVAVEQFLADHPNATAGIQGGRYWAITASDADGAPVADGFVAGLTLPAAEPDAATRVCKWPDGAGWDCGLLDGADTTFGKGTVTRSNISSFSDWAVGQDILPPIAPQVVIGLDAVGNAALEWTHFPANSSGHEVWWSASPYFAPGDAGSQKTTLPAPTDAFTHTGIAGQNSYYLVRGLNGAGQTSGPSNRTGRFTFALTPGSP
jgi:hypothetical protein